MRTGFKWLIAGLVGVMLIMVLAPIVQGWFVMM
jgi:hypothetical protein